MEGGNKCPAARLAGKKYVLACCRLGGNWIEYNEMTERFDYLYIKKGRRDVMRKSWRLLKRSSMQSEAASSAPEQPVAASGPQVVASETPVKDKKPLGPEVALGGKPHEGGQDGGNPTPMPPPDVPPNGSPPAAKSKAKAKAKAKAKPSDGEPVKRDLSNSAKKSKPKKQKTEFELKVDEAEAVRTKYMLATAKATLLKANIETNAAWGWGSSDATLGFLKRLLAAAEQALSTVCEIGQSFAAGCDVDDLITDSSTKKVFDAMTNFVSELEAPCENLMVHVAKVSQMHSIMNRA